MTNNASSNTKRVSRNSLQLASMLREDRHAERTTSLESERDQEVGMMDDRGSGGGTKNSSRHKRSKKHHKSRHKSRVHDKVIMEYAEDKPSPTAAAVNAIISTQHSEGNVATISSSSVNVNSQNNTPQAARYQHLSSFERKVTEHDKRREEKRQQRRRKEKKHSKSNYEKGKKKVMLAELKLPRGTLDNQETLSFTQYPSTNNEEEEATGKSFAIRTTHIMENHMSSALSALSPPNPMDSTTLQSELNFGSDDISVKNEVRSMFSNRAGSVPGVEMGMTRDNMDSTLTPDLERGSVGGEVGAQQQLQPSSQEQVEVNTTLFYPVEATLVESVRHLQVVYPVEATLIVSRHGSMESALDSKRKSMESMESSQCPAEHNEDNREGGTGVRDDGGENVPGDKLPWLRVHKKLLCGAAGVVVLGIVAAVAGVIFGSSECTNCKYMPTCFDSSVIQSSLASI